MTTTSSASLSDTDRTVDVVVVGSGAAALTGAYTAAAKGLDVLVLEKTDLIGGTSAYSGGGLWLPGNAVQARGGVEDSPADGLRYLRATVGDRTPVELHEAFIETGPELVAFLEKDPALEFETMAFPDYFEEPGRNKPVGRSICPSPIPGAVLGDRLELIRPTMGVDKFGLEESRETLSNGQALIARLVLAIDATGNAEIRTGCALESLIVVDGRVAGVRADGRGIGARIGVLVAAGGYEGNAELRLKHHGLPTAQWTSAPTGANTGDALSAVVDAGAATDLLDEAWWCPATLFPNGSAAFTLGLSGGIFVGPDGKRFGNESLPYDRMGHILLQKMREAGPDAEFWWVFDSRTDSVPGICTPAPDRVAFENAGLWRSGDTVEELATAIGVSPEALGATVARFNDFATAGEDTDFHRGEDDYDLFFAGGEGPNPVLVPIDRGQLHAVRIVLSDLGSKGGARIDTSGRVLGEDGGPIEGLYAAGNSAASIAGEVYPGPGVPLGSGMAFAYRAAIDMDSRRA
ncbi:FAD-dependent oxidoreductase [Gordonia sp. NPDC127522]|uniref:FAD-dependent oxidoreductase n=1 Tax=Gordonia sp. NPDC127522 TaxID=3345390 RepID=UPI00362DC935